MKINKKFLSAIKISRCKFLKSKIPLVVGIEVTSRCNSDCNYCKFNGEKNEIPTDKMKSFIFEMGDLGTKKIIFTGGEPLLRDDLGELIRVAKENELDVKLNSNGILVPEKIEEIRNINLLVLSLDGPKDVHNRLRGSGSYSKVLKAIKTAKKNDIAVALTAVISKDNLKEVSWLLKKSREWKTPINFQPVIDYQNPYEPLRTQNIKPYPDDLNEVLEEICEFKKSNRKSVRPSITTVKRIGDLYKNDSSPSCEVGRISCRIEGNKLAPCPRASEEERRSLEYGFENAWKNLNIKPKCNNICCTGTMEMLNLYGLDFPTIINELLYQNY